MEKKQFKNHKVALCVIDMQSSSFIGTYDCLSYVIKQVKLAIRRGGPIIFLQFEGHGPTLPVLKKLVKEYKNKVFITKKDCGGGKELMRGLRELKWKHKRVRVCGVQRAYCVAITIKQIMDKYWVEVPIKATGCVRRRNSHCKIKQLADKIM